MRAIILCAAASFGFAACGSDATTDRGSVEERPEPLTYWQDIAPLLAEHCLQCHVEGGIGPLQLDDYAKVRSFGTLIEHVTRERIMPPWGATSDGSCGEIADSIALSDREIARISSWVRAGMPEGTRESIRKPELPVLRGATEFEAPRFVPEIQGGELAEFDEYRCFALDAGVASTEFITGYEVVPGRDEIVHHVIGMLIDPDAPSESMPARTNGEQMRVLDEQSPDRAGWPCFGMAGEGVDVAAVPVAWAPGQGIVRYPNQSGVPFQPKHKLVIQIHYNLADSQNRGKDDQTTVRLRLEPRVERIGVFSLPDPFLTSIRTPTPATLPPGMRSTIYEWTRTAKQIGLPEGAEALFYGVAPHMHERGRKYRMLINAGGESPECAIDVQRWDFHWQRTYFYETPWLIRDDSTFSVSCDYDTSQDTTPIKPGWGTRNEMCLASLYFTLPISALGSL
ncbi:MAG TPA: hypothetical protein VJR89_05810 [Polyangiales bacterium]|nr:hypothetical protein [Polyangiales bacterium]